MSNFKRKYKFFKIYLVVSIVFTNFHFFDFLSKKPNFLSYNKHFEFSNDDETQSNIAKSKNNFSWLEKYQNDKNFINSDFNAYISGRLIEKVLIDRIFSLAKIAFLHHFQEYVLSCYNGNLKFAYTSYRSGFISFIMSMFYSPNEDSKLKIIQFDSNYFQLCAEKLDLDAIFDLNEFNFVLQDNHKNDFCEDIVSSFFSDQINGIYYVNENDKNDENNEVNKKVKDKIKQLKTKMNHAKKQLRVFHHSLSQPTLQLNDEISELNSYLAKMVVKMHELFDHTAVNKEIYDKSISEIMIEDNIRNLFFVWIKNFSIRDSLAYEDLPWFMCKHDDFFSYLTFHKKKYANGENINFKSAIADFLSLVKSNYTITTFEKAVASYIFATRNNKTIISCSSWTWKNWEEWIFQNWNTIMEGSAITVGAFIAFFFLSLSPINSIFFWPFRKLINVLPAKINEEKSDVPLFPKSPSWPNNAVTLKNIFGLSSSLTTMNKITNNNLVDVFENANNILLAVDFGLAFNNFLKFVTTKQYQNIDSIKSLSYREIFEMIEKETNEEEEMESADPIEINIEEASMEQIFSLPWSRGEDKGIFEKITKFNKWINGENDSWFDYLKKKWWEFRWKIKPKVKKFLEINNDKFPTLYYFNSRLWICNNDVLQNICNKKNFSKYRGKGLIPFKWILLPILKLFSKSWNFLSIDELILMIISYFKIENIDEKGISEGIGEIFDNCKLEFSVIDGKTQFFKIKSLPEQITKEIPGLGELEENNINNDNNGFIDDKVESSSIISAITKILIQKDESYLSLPNYVLKNIVRFSFEKIVQEKGHRIFDEKELQSSILQRINSIFKNKSFFFARVDANGEQQFIPIFLPKIIQKELSKKIVDDSEKFVKLNDIVLAIIKILKNDKSFPNLDVDKWNDFKTLVSDHLKNYFVKEIKIKKRFNDEELENTFSTNEVKNKSTAIKELINSFIDMSKNIKIMIGYDSLLEQYIFYTKSEYLPSSIRKQICINNGENIKDGITIQFDSVVKAIIEILKKDKRFHALSPKKLETIIEFYCYIVLKEFICSYGNTINNKISIANSDINKNENNWNYYCSSILDWWNSIFKNIKLPIEDDSEPKKKITILENDDEIINVSDKKKEITYDYIKKRVNSLLNNTEFITIPRGPKINNSVIHCFFYKSLPEKIKNLRKLEEVKCQHVSHSKLAKWIIHVLYDEDSQILKKYPINDKGEISSVLFKIVNNIMLNLIKFNSYVTDEDDNSNEWVDYDDLITLLIDLLSKNEEINQYYPKKLEEKYNSELFNIVDENVREIIHKCESNLESKVDIDNEIQKNYPKKLSKLESIEDILNEIFEDLPLIMLTKNNSFCWILLNFLPKAITKKIDEDKKMNIEGIDIVEKDSVFHAISSWLMDKYSYPIISKQMIYDTINRYFDKNNRIRSIDKIDEVNRCRFVKNRLRYDIKYDIKLLLDNVEFEKIKVLGVDKNSQTKSFFKYCFKYGPIIRNSQNCNKNNNNIDNNNNLIGEKYLFISKLLNKCTNFKFRNKLENYIIEFVKPLLHGAIFEKTNKDGQTSYVFDSKSLVSINNKLLELKKDKNEIILNEGNEDEEESNDKLNDNNLEEWIDFNSLINKIMGILAKDGKITLYYPEQNKNELLNIVKSNVLGIICEYGCEYGKNWEIDLHKDTCSYIFDSKSLVLINNLLEPKKEKNENIINGDGKESDDKLNDNNLEEWIDFNSLINKIVDILAKDEKIAPHYPEQNKNELLNIVKSNVFEIVSLLCNNNDGSKGIFKFNNMTIDQQQVDHNNIVKKNSNNEEEAEEEKNNDNEENNEQNKLNDYLIGRIKYLLDGAKIKDCDPCEDEFVFEYKNENGETQYFTNGEDIYNTIKKILPRYYPKNSNSPNKNDNFFKEKPLNIHSYIASIRGIVKEKIDNFFEFMKNAINKEIEELLINCEFRFKERDTRSEKVEKMIILHNGKQIEKNLIKNLILKFEKKYINEIPKYFCNYDLHSGIIDAFHISFIKHYRWINQFLNVKCNAKKVKFDNEIIDEYFKPFEPITINYWRSIINDAIKKSNLCPTYDDAGLHFDPKSDRGTIITISKEDGINSIMKIVSKILESNGDNPMMLPLHKMPTLLQLLIENYFSYNKEYFIVKK